MTSRERTHFFSVQSLLAWQQEKNKNKNHNNPIKRESTALERIHN
jgi:hypothetical protein